MQRERERGREAGGRGPGEHGERHPRVVREVGDQLPHLLQGIPLHQDVVLGQQQGGDLAQLPHRGRVGVGDDAPQLVHRVVEVMHSPPLPGVDGQALNLKRRALEVLQTLKIGKFDNFIRKSDKRRHVYYSVIGRLCSLSEKITKL